MTFLEAPKASFLVAEKLESLVNCWDDLTRVRGVGPSQNVQSFLAFSLPRTLKNKAPAVGNLELKRRFGTDTFLSDCPRLPDCLTVPDCSSPLSPPHAEVAF